jgi:hypothetical protein
VVYSYLDRYELLEVSSLSKCERETVLNSKIVKENRKEFKSKFWNKFSYLYPTNFEVQGVLIAI